MKLPSINPYGNYSSSNYGVHSLTVVAGEIQLWFSYKTCIAFFTPETGFVIRENDWGPTTGKHLNWIDDDKSKRVPSKVFQEKWNQAFKDEEVPTI